MLIPRGAAYASWLRIYPYYLIRIMPAKGREISYLHNMYDESPFPLCQNDKEVFHFVRNVC